MTDPAALAEELDARLRPVELELAAAWWESNTSASAESEKRREQAELRRRQALGDRQLFAAVVEARQRASDPVVRRVLEIVGNAMAPEQLDEEMRRRLIELETAVESIFVSHRGEIDGRRASDNDIERVLLTSDQADERRKAWEASKTVGQAASATLLELVRLRNEAARQLGHPDYHAMALASQELDEQRLLATLTELDQVTAEPFGAWKDDLDRQLARRFGCTEEDLRPWHYDDPFFQEAPVTGRPQLDAHFAGADLVDLTVRTYERLGLDVSSVMAASDLYAREGKSQHAFCLALDRDRDVRVLANIDPSERWMSVMLHEFGHAAYDLGIDRSLPFLLRDAAHHLTTEAVAMLFGRLVHDPAWLEAVMGIDADPDLEAALRSAQRTALLVFARWSLVMVNFERGLYQQPDADHAGRWWDLVERFQLVPRPDGGPGLEGAWAAKVHLAVAPVYYQNYLYGELMASQLSAALAEAAGGIVDRPEAGRWLTDRVFRPGASKRWDHLVSDATGEPLTARHMVAELQRS